MASVIGLLEARETDARVRVEALRAEADRILGEPQQAEAVLERRVIARVELAEALASPGEESQREEQPEPAGEKVPVAGSVVPRWREGMTADVLAPDYQRIMAALGAEASDVSWRPLTGLSMPPATSVIGRSR